MSSKKCTHPGERCEVAWAVQQQQQLLPMTLHVPFVQILLKISFETLTWRPEKVLIG